MADQLFIIISVIFFIWLIRNTLYWIYLWQIKEYRLDRMKVHLAETEQGKKLLFDLPHILKIAIFIFYSALIFDNRLTSLYIYLVFLVYLISFIQVAEEVINRRIKIPVLTLKSLTIFILTVLASGLLYYFHLMDKFFWLLLIDMLIAFFVAIQIGIFSVPSDIHKDIKIYKAIEKRNKYKNLKVIGITGSYGKGSTKEYLSEILSYKFNVLKTQGTQNTDIGIANTILAKLNSKKEIFIVEMGAYKIGEIARMCYIVKPDIGILTAVNNQHVSLFGSMKNIMTAKYELIDYIPRDGLALFNGNNRNAMRLSKKTKKSKIIYYAEHGNNKIQNPSIQATDIKVNKFTVIFNVTVEEKKEIFKSLKVKLLGGHNIENILPGIFLALHFGMGRNEIKKALDRIVPVGKTMEPFTSSKQLVMVDDTFNSNPSAIFAVCEYLKIYKGRKVIIMQPLIELGEHSDQDHYNVAFSIGKICDYLILTNSNHFDVIEKGIKDSGNKCFLQVMNPKKTIQFIQTNFGKDDVVVFEGKEAGLVFAQLEHEKVY